MLVTLTIELTSMSDQEKISPYNINAKSSRQGIRINKKIWINPDDGKQPKMFGLNILIF